MSDDQPELSILIVTWNAVPVIGRCLTLLAEANISRSFEVVLVDNQSQDGTVDLVRSTYPWVRLIEEDANHGFGVGTNIAARHAKGRLLLLLNPDAYLTDPDAVDKVADWLDGHPDVAGAGVQLTFEDGRHQVGDAGAVPGPLSVIVHGFALQRIVPRLPSLFLARPPVSPTDVGWICGAFLMIRREVFASVGGFDPGIFLYGEDIDLGSRLTDGGRRLVYLPHIRVVHAQGGTQQTPQGSRRIPTLWLDGVAAAYVRRRPGSLAVCRFALSWGFAGKALVLRLMAKLRGSEELAQRADVMEAWSRHAATLAPAVPKA